MCFIKMAFKLELRTGMHNSVGYMPERGIVADYKNQYHKYTTSLTNEMKICRVWTFPTRESSSVWNLIEDTKKLKRIFHEKIKPKI